MPVVGTTLDLNWFLQLIFTLSVIAFAALQLLKNTASKYFEVDASFDRERITNSVNMESENFTCIICSNTASKRCSGCKSVWYCSMDCQQKDWKDGHLKRCRLKSAKTASKKPFSGIALIPAIGTSNYIKKPRKVIKTYRCSFKTLMRYRRPVVDVPQGFLEQKNEDFPMLQQARVIEIFSKNFVQVLFPYDEFVKLFNWKKSGFPPCGLLNCGNSCYANVVLQCLVSTRPLIAFLSEKGHRRECRRNDWCFLCEFEAHAERSSLSTHPFSPINIISRLPNIGGNLGYGRQEDAHEFMRFAIDTMQSACLDEFGGEKAVDPFSRETTLIQHIFGGHLQSQVICTNCNRISNLYENMMDLTVEIDGDASSLEECLDQFTVKEWLHGENMYKCDGCNDYVKAWKCLTIRWAPNILTIALKRFQSGSFGKLNKRVSFPEMLDLTPYMSEDGDDTNVYKLYAVVVHVDMLNASYFGHYICYTKDFSGNWYRVDDSKVMRVELEEVLSQGAYMLLYSRVSVRSSCLVTSRSQCKDEQKEMKAELEHGLKEPTEGVTRKESSDSPSCSFPLSMTGSLNSEIPKQGVKYFTTVSTDSIRGHVDGDLLNGFMLNSSCSKAVSIVENYLRVDDEDMGRISSPALRENYLENKDMTSAQLCSSDKEEVPSSDKDLFHATDSEIVGKNSVIRKLVEVDQDSSVIKERKYCAQDSQVAIDDAAEDSPTDDAAEVPQVAADEVGKDSQVIGMADNYINMFDVDMVDVDMVDSEPISSVAGNGNSIPSPGETSLPRYPKLKRD